MKISAIIGWILSLFILLALGDLFLKGIMVDFSILDAISLDKAGLLRTYQIGIGSLGIIGLITLLVSTIGGKK